MAIKTITASANEIKKTTRLEPRYFYHQSLLEQYFDKYGFDTFNNFVSLKSGSTPKHYDERKSKDDFYFIKSADVKRYNLNFTTISYVSKEIHNERKKIKVIPNDVLLSNTGKYLGFACIVPETIHESTTNQNIIRIRFNDNAKTIFTPFFIMTFLNSLFGQIEIESLLTLTGQKYLNMQKLREFKIPKIDKVTINKIDKLTQTIINNETMALSLIQQAKNIFYNKINIDFSNIKKEKYYSVNLSQFNNADLWTPAFSYPLYVKTLKTIQNKWQTVTIDEIATVKKGDEVGSVNYNKYLYKKDTDIPFIRTSDLVNYEVDQFPDFYIPEEIYVELDQDIKSGDILFTKDGKIGMSAMITKNDKAIIASGIVRLRLKLEAKKHNITPEYLFIILSLKETGLYPAIRRTVIASTIPHLREERLKEFEIPILDKNTIEEITKLVKEAIKLKDEKKKLLRDVRNVIDSYFII